MANDLIKTHGLREVIRNRHDEIQKVYLNDNRPWIIGYSGGKDSTCMLQLIYNAIKELPKEKRHKPVYVVSSDTLVENPLILNYLNNNIRSINEAANQDDLPITADPVKPELKDSFWTLLIGKGYPSPRQKFRWCTSRLKIDPIDRFIDEQTTKHEEVIVVLGVRKSESQSRQLSIESKTIEGKILKTHTSNPKAYVYAPIEDFTLDDVWTYLQLVPNPWNGHNDTLLSLYRDASDESECPIQQDTNAPSCGQSRFGCWCCTVVVQDKSLTGFIQNGYFELAPLLKFRNMVYQMRDQGEYRQKWRMNGSIYYLTTQDNQKKQGLGPFTLEARKLMLEELLKTEKEYNKLLKQRPKSNFDSPIDEYFNLISKEELLLIRDYWINDGDWEDSLPDIYSRQTGSTLPLEDVHAPLLQKDELALLESLCTEHDLPSNVVKKLLLIEDEYCDIKIRKGLMQKINSVLRQDWVHEEIIQGLMGENQNEDQ